MNAKTEKQKLEAKRPYQAPELKAFGSLQRMTQTSLTGDIPALDFAGLMYANS